MWLRKASHTILLIIASIHVITCEKGSLTYVIDNTLSMTDDIDQVKSNTDLITKTVFDEAASQIKNMVLVTFNDPKASLETITEDRDDFKSKINELYVHNNYSNSDCPEMSMTGILLALKKSLPRSFIYVFTDASAKDYEKGTEIQILCQEKKTQIVFVLTGYCKWDRFKPPFQVYYDIAAACSGLAFFVGKEHVSSIFVPIKDAIKGKKGMITSRTIPAYTRQTIHFDIINGTDYATVTAAGFDVMLSVRGPKLYPRRWTHYQEKLTWLPNVKVLRLTQLTPGRYMANVFSSSVTTINIIGKSDFSFEYGFSEFEPTTFKDIGAQPIANATTRLFIKVNDPYDSVDIKSAHILDMNENVIDYYKLPLTRIGNDYYSTPSFMSPSKIFKIAVYGQETNSGKDIRHLAPFPITPQPAKKKPVVMISQGISMKSEYGKSLTLTCKVTAYPEPAIEWTDSNYKNIKSQVSVVESPYEYVSYLTIPQVTDSGKYYCHATNDVGEDYKTFDVIVKDPFNVRFPLNDTIEVKYGNEAILKCGIASSQPVQYSWTFIDKKKNVRHQVMPSDEYLLSADGSVLYIKKMNLNMAGTYACTASLNSNRKLKTHSTEVKLVGLSFPKITRNSVAFRSIEGRDRILKIPCTATGLPKPIITWKLGINTIRPNSKYSIEDGSLVINEPTISDSAVYVCQATNEAGSDSASFEAQILQVPQVTGEPTKTVRVGLYTTLKCIVTKGVPSPTISWQILVKDEWKLIQLVSTENVLRIPTVSEVNSGRYKCIAQNSAGISEHITVLNIQVPPKVSTNSTVYKSIEGKESVLRILCKATGFPKPTIIWTTRHKPIMTSHKYNLEDGALVIKNPKVEDTGTYVCEARNEVGSDKVSFRAEILQMPQIKGDSSKTVKAGTSLNINCTVTEGVPPPTITWQFVAERNSKIIQLPSSDSVLHISAVSEKDAGRYKCIAHNIVGEAEHVTVLTVQVTPTITSDNSKMYQALEGKDTKLIIPCTTTGLPKPTIKWKSKQESIMSNHKYHLEEGDLIIKDPTVNDTGIYVCTAKNEAGSVNVSFHVDILQIPQISGESSRVVRAGTLVHIECEIMKGVPSPNITWQFMGKDESKFVQIPGSDKVLRLSTVNEENAGHYKCIAENVVGVAEHVTTIVVEFAPYIAANISNIYEGLEGDEAMKIKCNVIGVPPPIVSWSVNGKTISSDSHYSILDDVLTIVRPMEIDTGVYRCKTSNYLGSTHASFNATVKDYLDDFGIIESVAINKLKYTSFRLECGSPDQSVRWFMEGVDMNVTGIYFVLSELDAAYNGNYTCRVSDMSGAYTKTYRVKISSPPVFQFPQEDTIFDWTGNDNDNDKLDCSVESDDRTKIEWVYNGEILSGRTSSLLSIEGKWGHYTCNVSNSFGAIQRSFDVKSSVCLMPKNYQFMPLILNEGNTWPILRTSAKYFTFGPGEGIKLSCPNYGTERNNFKNFPDLHELTAICEKQDLFVVDRKKYKVYDLGCDHDVTPTAIIKNEQCAPGSTINIAVGYNISNFLQTYEVCFDSSNKIPLFAGVMSPFSYPNATLDSNWFIHPAVNFTKNENVYTCENSTSNCCYSKDQLVSANDFSAGTTQRTTFIDSINAVPIWRPCKETESSWKDIEDMIRWQLDLLPASMIWSGTHALQTVNGHLVPRYLFKLVEFIDENPIAVVYINGPSPTDADVLCQNICGNGEITWLQNLDEHVYCCNGEDFRKSFSF